MPTVFDEESVIIEVATGDIGRTAVEGGPWLAVVSSDDSMLSHGGGSSESIWEVAGDIEVSDDLLPARLGSIVRTSAGDLPADILLHAVTIDVDRWVGMDSVEYASMVDRLGNILEHWSQRTENEPGDGWHRVLLPALGTGAGGVPTSLAVREGERLAIRLQQHRIRIVLATPWTMEELESLAALHLEHARLVAWRRARASQRASWQLLEADRSADVEMLECVLGDLATERSRLEEDPKWRHLLSEYLSSSDQPSSTPSHTHQAPHVERLVDLLDGLSGIERDDLDEWMESLGYKGEARLQLKELCVRMDPAVVVERLGAGRIRHLLKSEFGISASSQTPLPGLIDQLLGACGFKQVPEPLGVESAARDVERLRTALVMSEPHDRAGIVLEASGRLETVVRDLLRFLCLHVHDAGPERHLKDCAGYDGRPLSSTTLGMMLTLLGKMAESFDDPGEEGPVDLNGPLAAERVVPGGFASMAAELVPIRNAFAHAHQQGASSAEAAASLDKATRFLELTERLLAFWRDGEPRLFPKVVRVDRITIDRWNRRLIEAVNDAGTEEAIVCDHEIHPGRLYYMLPRTNPFRVDPILVEFGRADVKD